MNNLKAKPMAATTSERNSSLAPVFQAQVNAAVRQLQLVSLSMYETY
jgi:hypothetical protein